MMMIIMMIMIMINNFCLLWRTWEQEQLVSCTIPIDQLCMCYHNSEYFDVIFSKSRSNRLEMSKVFSSHRPYLSKRMSLVSFELYSFKTTSVSNDCLTLKRWGGAAFRQQCSTALLMSSSERTFDNPPNQFLRRFDTATNQFV